MERERPSADERALDFARAERGGLSRRELLALTGMAGPLLQAAPARSPSSDGGVSTARGPMLTRPIPKTGELLPVMGMGTWETFDVGASDAARAPLRAVLDGFFAAGARVIDSSPMYGRAEGVVGDLLQQAGRRPVSFLATKVWTTGREAGVKQMEQSFQRLRTSTVDLMQVHNLVDVKTHLRTLRGLKQEGKVRYVGITHYLASAFDALAELMRSEPLDFVQLPYSLGFREAEKALLPLAQEKGLAVLVMRPFEGGSLFSRVRGKPLPPWAAELGCRSWAQVLLKWLLGHPAVTCPIPATRNPAHMADNLEAGFGRLPDPALRKRMAQELENL